MLPSTTTTKTPSFAKLKKLASTIVVDSVSTSVAKTLVQDDFTCAVALDLALKRLIGDYEAWEPESIWMELTNKNVTISDLNKSKVLAINTLKAMPSFYWDAIVLEKTTLAFNDVLGNPDILQETFPEHLSWAILEAEVFRQQVALHVPEFDSECVSYTAVVLHRAGFVIAPEQLSFSQDLLDKINYNKDLKKEVTETWDKLSKTDLHDHPFSESAVDVQLAKLASVYSYVEERKKKCALDLAALRG